MKIRLEMNKIEAKNIEKINGNRSWFSEKINKVDKSLARITQKRMEEGPNK